MLVFSKSNPIELILTALNERISSTRLKQKFEKLTETTNTYERKKKLAYEIFSTDCFTNYVYG